MITVTSPNLKTIEMKWRRARSLRIGLKESREFADNMLQALRKYPPAIGTYERTYNLQGGWVVDVRYSDDLVTIRLKNTVPYAGYVQGKEDQAWMHKGRWITVEDYMDKYSKEWLQKIGDRYKKELG